jgi:hypothetical protein
MPLVPTAKRETSARSSALAPQFQQVAGAGDIAAFGGSSNPSNNFARLGQTLDQYAAIVEANQDEDNRTEAKRIIADHDNNLRIVAVGDGDQRGYLSQLGADAVANAGAARKSLGTSMSTALESASNPDVKNLITPLLADSNNRALTSVERHLITQRGKASVDASNALIASKNSLALGGDPVAVAVAEQTITTEMRSQGDRAGWQPETLEWNQRKAISGLHSAVATSLATDEGAGGKLAMEYFALNVTKFVGEDLIRVKKLVADAYLTTQSQEVAEEYIQRLQNGDSFLDLRDEMARSLSGKLQDETIKRVKRYFSLLKEMLRAEDQQRNQNARERNQDQKERTNAIKLRLDEALLAAKDEIAASFAGTTEDLMATLEGRGFTGEQFGEARDTFRAALLKQSMSLFEHTKKVGELAAERALVDASRAANEVVFGIGSTITPQKWAENNPVLQKLLAANGKWGPLLTAHNSIVLGEFFVQPGTEKHNPDLVPNFLSKSIEFRANASFVSLKGIVTRQQLNQLEYQRTAAIKYLEAVQQPKPGDATAVTKAINSLRLTDSVKAKLGPGLFVDLSLYVDEVRATKKLPSQTDINREAGRLMIKIERPSKVFGMGAGINQGIKGLFRSSIGSTTARKFLEAAGLTPEEFVRNLAGEEKNRYELGAGFTLKGRLSEIQPSVLSFVRNALAAEFRADNSEDYRELTEDAVLAFAVGGKDGLEEFVNLKTVSVQRVEE